LINARVIFKWRPGVRVVAVWIPRVLSAVRLHCNWYIRGSTVDLLLELALRLLALRM
jgi:hypothetical protein